MKTFPLIVALIIAMAMPIPTLAQADPAIGASIDEISMGTYWYGKQIDKKDLIGKVVLLEIWGS